MQCVILSEYDTSKRLLQMSVLLKVRTNGLDTCYSANYVSQTRDQQRFTISEVAADWHSLSQWCRSALCGHLLSVLTDNWSHHSAVSRHTIAPISHTRPSSRSRRYYSFPVRLRVGGRVGLSTQYVSNLLNLWTIEPATSPLRVWYSTTTPLHPTLSVYHVQLHKASLNRASVFAARCYAKARPILYCSSVRPSYSWILSKRINIKILSSSDSQIILLFRTKRHGNIPTGNP